MFLWDFPHFINQSKGNRLMETSIDSPAVMLLWLGPWWAEVELSLPWETCPTTQLAEAHSVHRYTKRRKLPWGVGKSINVRVEFSDFFSVIKHGTEEFTINITIGWCMVVLNCHIWLAECTSFLIFSAWKFDGQNPEQVLNLETRETSQIRNGLNLPQLQSQKDKCLS